MVEKLCKIVVDYEIDVFFYLVLVIIICGVVDIWDYDSVEVCIYVIDKKLYVGKELGWNVVIK